MDPPLRCGLGRDGGPQGDRAGRGPARPGAGARGRGGRPARPGPLRLPDEPGGRRVDAAHRAGLLPSGRPDLPPPRPDLRREARGRRDPHGGDRHGVRAEPPGLCEAMRVPRPAPGPRLGRRSAREHRYLAARHIHWIALRRGLARAHGGVRDPGDAVRHRRHAHRSRDRHLRRGRPAAQRALGGRDREGVRYLRMETLPRSGDRGPGPGRAHGRAARGPRLPDRRLQDRGRDPAPADGPQHPPRRGRAMGRGGRERRRAQVLYRSPGRGPDRLGLPGHRKAGRDLGPDAAHRVRVPLRGRLPHGGAPDAHPRGRRDLPVLLRRDRLDPELGAALRDPPPDLHGRGRRAHERGRPHAGRRERRIARRPGRDPGRGLRRGRDVGLPLDVRALPRRGPGLRGGQGDHARHLGSRRRPGRGLLGGPRGHDGQYLPRQHPGRRPPLRNARGPPAPHLHARRYGPLYRLRPRGRGLHRDRRRYRGHGRRFRHQPDPGGRASGSPNPLRSATRAGQAPPGSRPGTGRPRPARRARPLRPIRRPWSSGSPGTCTRASPIRGA